MAEGLLSDLKIVEFGSFISASFCSKLMGDLGADVIKVEEPGVGDEVRRHGPFYKDIPDPEASGLFLYLNTNKKSLTLNVKVATGKKVLLDLLEDADIFVENNPPHVMEELGLTYEVLSRINPRLIMTSITYFGQTGPYRDYKGSDLIALSLGGVAYGTPLTVEDPEAYRPLRGGGHQAEFTAGAAASSTTMGAIFHRMFTDEGQQVDISVSDVMATLPRNAMATYFYGGPVPNRTSEAVLPLSTRLYKTKDGFAAIGAAADQHFANMVKAMGDPEWAENPMFATREGRAEFGDALGAMVQDWVSGYTTYDAYTLLQQFHVPCFPVNRIDDIVNSGHLNDRGLFVEIDHPKTGKVLYPGSATRYSKQVWSIRAPAPFLGQHNEEILCQRLGYSREQLVQMTQLGVI